jgi:hypothetical protein
MKALEAAEYQILGDITSKDIADGHREKTLSLLWQIIYKFRAPRFNAAAKTIQKFWRSKMLMVTINRRIRHKEEERLARAATVIQKVSVVDSYRNLLRGLGFSGSGVICFDELPLIAEDCQRDQSSNC